jgi:hypothetical protein
MNERHPDLVLETMGTNMRKVCGRNLLIFLSAVALVGAATATEAGVIANWQFESGSFLGDSSGNGYTLVPGVTGATPAQSTDVSTLAGGAGSAYFDGVNDWIQTTKTIDLRSYNALRVSAWIKPQSSTSGILWEQGPTILKNAGSVNAVVNDGGYAKAAICASGNGSYAVDKYSTMQNTWQKLAVEYRRNVTGSDSVQVFLNDAKVGADSATAIVYSSFLNSTLNIGARQNAGSGSPGSYFAGKIDELKIEDISTSTQRATPTKLYIIAGQSNAVGQYAYNGQLPSSLQTSQDNVSVYCDSSWQTLTPGLGATTSEFGPEVTFGHDIAAAYPNEKIGLIKYAVGATSLWEDWKAGETAATSGPQYLGLLQAIENALSSLGTGETPQIAGIVWMQGESDAIEGHGAQYGANLANFIKQLRADLEQPDLEFAIGQIHHNWPGDPLDVMQAQTAVCAADPLTHFVFTDDLSTYSRHYDAAGQMELGSRFAAALVPEPTSFALLATAAVFCGLFCAWPRWNQRFGKKKCPVVVSHSILSSFLGDAL